MIKTSLSIGNAVADLLNNNKEIKGKKVTKIFPVVTYDAILPYIAYRRIDLSPALTKSASGADTVNIEICCFSASYQDSLELAELVRMALDFKAWELAGIKIRSCNLTNSSETWSNDAYTQSLIFTIKL